jgi:hypothetical protein
MDPVQVQDENRTVRAFISFLSTAVGNDQSLPSTDGNAINRPREYQTIGPGGLVGIEGTASSNAQGSKVAFSVSPLLLLGVAAAAWFLLKK